MALPRTGTLGQKVEYNGYVYQWTGVGWNIIGQSLLVVANTNIFANNNLTMGNSTVNTLITSAIITTGNNAANSRISVDAVSVANSVSSTVINPRGVFTGNSTVNVNITANAFTVGDTTLASDGIISGNNTVNTHFTANGIFITNSTSNSIITSNNISISNSTTNTSIGLNRITIGNSTINVVANNSTVAFGVATINSIFYTGTANNANYVSGISATNYVRTEGTFNLNGNYTFSGNSSFTSNVNVTGGKIFYDTGVSYYTGTAYNALNSDALGNYPIEEFQLIVDMPTAVGGLTANNATYLGDYLASSYQLNSTLSANVAKLTSNSTTYFGGALSSAYVNTSGNYTISGIHTHTNNVEIRNSKLVINTSSSIWANGGIGLNGYLLVSNGTTVYWAPPGQVIDVNSRYSWTNTHTFSNTITFGNSTVNSTVNSTMFTGTANNANSLGGVLYTSYALKTYADSSSSTAAANAYTWAMANTLSRNGLYTGNNTFSGANLTFSGTIFAINTGYQVIGNSTVNSFINSTSLSISNSSSNVNINSSRLSVGNTTVNLTVNSTTIAIGTSTINSSIYTGKSNSANDSSYLNGVAAASYVNTTGSYTITGIHRHDANIKITTIDLNGSTGLGGQVLTSNGTSNAFWTTVGGEGGIGTVTSVGSGNGLFGGPIVGFGSLSVLANSGIVSNSTGVFVNTSYISTISSNSAAYLGTRAASEYALLSGASFTGDVAISGNLSVTGNLSISGNSVSIGANSLVVQDAVISLHTTADLGPLTSNDGRLVGVAYHYYIGGDKQALLAVNQTNAFLTYYSTSTDAISGDPVGQNLGTIQANVFYAGNSTVFSTVNSTIYTGTARNSNSLGGLDAGSYVNTTTSASFINATGNYTISGKHIHTANITVNTAIIAGGTAGVFGQVLASNGTSNVYWADLNTLAGAGSVTSVSSGNGLTGGPITSTGTLDVLANNGIVANSTGVFVKANTGLTVNSSGLFVRANSGLVANSSGLHVNTTFIGDQAANNAYYLVGADGNKFIQNTDSRSLSGNLTFTGTNTVFQSNISVTGYVSNSLIPSVSSGIQNLGNSTNKWNRLYVSSNGAYIGNSYLTDDSGGTGYLVVNGAIVNTANINYASVNNFTANSSNVTTLQLVNALAVNSGGTGINFYASGDMVYASGPYDFDVVSVPLGVGVEANGKILQLINNLPAWSDIDCGTF